MIFFGPRCHCVCMRKSCLFYDEWRNAACSHKFSFVREERKTQKSFLLWVDRRRWWQKERQASNRFIHNRPEEIIFYWMFIYIMPTHSPPTFAARSQLPPHENMWIEFSEAAASESSGGKNILIKPKPHAINLFISPNVRWLFPVSLIFCLHFSRSRIFH